MTDGSNPNPEEKAVDALITGTLHAWSREEISEAEINEFLSSKVELNAAEQEALNRIQEKFRRGYIPAETSHHSSLKEELESSYMAMNRENSIDQLPTATKEEIEEKRAKLLAQLKDQKRSAG